ncbi:MAG: PrpF domain-containing protein [Cuspidothrix sp.]
MTGAICVGCCSLLKGSVADGIATSTGSGNEIVIIEHPSGKVKVSLVTSTHDSTMIVESAGIVRTVHLILSGNVYVFSRLN